MIPDVTDIHAFLPRRSRRRAGGFTLIELMVVLVIIGVLAALIVPNVLGRADEAKITGARTDLQTIRQALKLYKLDNGNYPTPEQGLEALVQRPGGVPEARNWKEGGYLSRLPRDPWGNPYQYLSPGRSGDFEVYTLGKDGQPGGEGYNADIGNWDL